MKKYLEEFKSLLVCMGYDASVSPVGGIADAGSAIVTVLVDLGDRRFVWDRRETSHGVKIYPRGFEFSTLKGGQYSLTSILQSTEDARFFLDLFAYPRGSAGRVVGPLSVPVGLRKMAEAV